MPLTLQFLDARGLAQCMRRTLPVRSKPLSALRGPSRAGRQHEKHDRESRCNDHGLRCGHIAFAFSQRLVANIRAERSFTVWRGFVNGCDQVQLTLRRYLQPLGDGIFNRPAGLDRTRMPTKHSRLSRRTFSCASGSRSSTLRGGIVQWARPPS